MKSFIPPTWEVPEVFRRRLGEGAGRQRAMTADSHLLLVLHAPPAPGVPERSGRLFWRSPDGDWKSNELGQGTQALKRHVAEVAARVDDLERQWEASAGAADYYRLLQAVAPTHRTARNLHLALQQARELLPDDRDLLNLRDQANEIERALDLLHGDARNGLDFTVAYQAEEQARRVYEMAVASHRLNLLAAIFFPVVTLAAVFGMNLAHGIEDAGTPDFFWAVLGLGLVGGMILAVLIARRPAALQPKPATAAKRR